MIVWLQYQRALKINQARCGTYLKDYRKYNKFKTLRTSKPL